MRVNSEVLQVTVGTANYGTDLLMPTLLLKLPR